MNEIDYRPVLSSIGLTLSFIGLVLLGIAFEITNLRKALVRHSEDPPTE